MRLADRVLRKLDEVAVDDGVGEPEPTGYADGGVVCVRFDTHQDMEDALARIARLPDGTPSYERGPDGRSLLFPRYKNKGNPERLEKAVAHLKKMGLARAVEERDAL